MRNDYDKEEPKRIQEFNAGRIDELWIGGFDGEDIEFKRITTLFIIRQSAKSALRNPF